VSAMGKATDQLVTLARQVSRNPHGRDYDLLLASGEQVAVAMLALALQDKGIPAVALTGAQCNIRTDGSFNRARIRSIDTARIEEELRKGKVVIVAGFQGVTENDEVTTLGRGGGDITGAAVAAALNASVCEICTDVDGVLSADPNVVPDARFWPELTYEEAIEMASSGAKVLHPRAAEICKSYKIPIHIRSSFHLKEGTWIREGARSMEEAEVVGVTSDKKIAKVTLLNVPDEPGIAAQIFKDVADKDINIRLIIQSAAADHRAGITFIIEDSFADAAQKLVDDWTAKGVAREGMVETSWATIAIIGHRLAATPGLSARMFAALARAGINVDCISSSEMTMSCIINRDQIDRGVKAVHEEFFAGQAAAPKAAAAR
jgi:aspartate kinase